VLRAVDFEVAPGETVALMGRNGAGKSTLLRTLAGLERPDRGEALASGPVALLLQNPGDYLLAERVGDEAGEESLARAGLADVVERHPRDLSGGQRQRLALALMTEGEAPAALLLDEPTRGMDRAARGELVSRLAELAGAGAGIVVATHDAELAAVVADRVVLLSGGRPVADGPPSEVLCGGWHFSTETARVLGGAGGACTPEQGGELLRGAMSVEVAP
jgi:energy-coupling factor transport system ATP-binding protein